MDRDGMDGRTDLERLTDSEFVAGWRKVTGQPPAALLDDRRAMITLLVETTPVAPPSMHLLRSVRADDP